MICTLRRTRALARFAVHVWAWTALILPALHVAQHVEEAAGCVHSHGGTRHSHGPAAPTGSEPGHGRGSPEHLTVAFRGAPVFAIVRFATAVVAPAIAAPGAPPELAPHRRPIQPRGPPAAPVV